MTRYIAMLSFIVALIAGPPLQARVDDLPDFKYFNGTSYEVLDRWGDVRCLIFGTCAGNLFEGENRSEEELSQYLGWMVYFKAAVECGPDYDPIFYHYNARKRVELSAPKLSLNRYAVYADDIDDEDFVWQRNNFKSKWLKAACDANHETMQVLVYGEVVGYKYRGSPESHSIDALRINLHRLRLGRKIINQYVEAGLVTLKTVFGPRGKAKAACKAIEATGAGSCRRIPYIGN